MQVHGTGGTDSPVPRWPAHMYKQKMICRVAANEKDVWYEQQQNDIEFSHAHETSKQETSLKTIATAK